MNELLSGQPHLISGATLSQVTVTGTNPVSKQNPSDINVMGADPNKTVTIEVQNANGGVQVSATENLTEPQPGVYIYTAPNVSQINQVTIDGQTYQESGASISIAYQ
ncbi:MAG TPA: hypothetical protein VKV17_16065 [Bryobacteraceae bacterium]|nr:hypothetical protein [Bryobacteraceae bacterium]